MKAQPEQGTAEDMRKIRESDRRWAAENPQTASGEWGTTPENQAARDRHVLLDIIGACTQTRELPFVVHCSIS